MLIHSNYRDYNVQFNENIESVYMYEANPDTMLVRAFEVCWQKNIVVSFKEDHKISLFVFSF